MGISRLPNGHRNLSGDADLVSTTFLSHIPPLLFDALRRLHDHTHLDRDHIRPCTRLGLAHQIYRVCIMNVSQDTNGSYWSRVKVIELTRIAFPLESLGLNLCV